MKRCPHAVWDPLGDQTQPKMTAHDIVCVHTMVGHLVGTRAMFKKNGYGGTESTYGIGGDWGPDQLEKWDGHAFQWQDRAHTADANYQGNPRIISIETADNYPATAAKIVRWTPKQVDKLVEIIAWECSLAAHSECPESWDCRKGVTWSGIKVAIPPVLVADSCSNRRGLAYHRIGIDPWRASGCQQWSTAYGKECPGPVRITQFRNEVIPRVQQVLKGEDMPTEKEFWSWDGLRAPKRETNPDNKYWAASTYLRKILDQIDADAARLVNIARDASDAVAQSEANRDTLALLTAKVDGLDVEAARVAILAAGEEAANKVTTAGEALLAKLDALVIDINRG